MVSPLVGPYQHDLTRMLSMTSHSKYKFQASVCVEITKAPTQITSLACIYEVIMFPESIEHGRSKGVFVIFDGYLTGSKVQFEDDQVSFGGA